LAYNERMVKKARKRRAGWKKEKSDFAYHFKPSVAKRLHANRILFKGFKARPVGLSLFESGGGFNFRQSNKIGGDHLLNFLGKKYEKTLKLNIYKESIVSSFRILKKNVCIDISFDNFIALVKDLGDEINKSKEAVIQKRLANFFPDNFKVSGPTEKVANSKLGDINFNALKKEDHEAIGDFIKRYISLNADNDQVLKKLQTILVIQGRKKTLDQVIKKFDKHLSDAKYSEKQWQKFLHEEVFFFVSNYLESIREANVNFGKTDGGEKKPDFVWIDAYGFLDVFEIKTPQTDILAKRMDDSHKNYYFSSDASKAISQIEKYILFLENNVEGFEKYLSRQTKFPFSVLRPKAFLIIGSSKEFEKNPEKKKDFRLLRRLFKNIEFITFDELLDNLKSLSAKFEKDL
jgi:hypothetical protein